MNDLIFVRGCLFMPRNVAAKASSRDPLKTVADALIRLSRLPRTVRPMRGRLRERCFPLPADFCRGLFTRPHTRFHTGLYFQRCYSRNRFPRTTPSCMGLSMAHAANDLVVQMKHRRLEAPTQPVRSRTRTTKAKRKTRAEGLSACSPRSKRRVDSRRGTRIA